VLQSILLAQLHEIKIDMPENGQWQQAGTNPYAQLHIRVIMNSSRLCEVSELIPLRVRLQEALRDLMQM